MDAISKKRHIIKITLAVLIILAILAILATGIVLSAILKEKAAPKRQIRTDMEPIYNHFPDLPATEHIQWCSQTSGGIGLTTVRLYVFAFYDDDISAELGEEEISDENPDFYFLPENLPENWTEYITQNHSGWRKLKHAGNAFQSGIKDSRKMYTAVYLNEAGNIIYLEAIGN